ncbi:MAG: ParA family protein [Candidatus Lernaella stagnicola]|nr:ParA family protein [Candidatus Lernaella stagnicola]
MRKIAFVNEKGGSCKTTFAVNISSYLARRGDKVCLIDMDPQGQVGKSLGFDVVAIQPSIFDVLTNPDVAARDAVFSTSDENLNVIVANKSLVDFTVLTANDEDRVFKLKNKLDRLRGYDWIVIDSPPSLGLLTLNIMMAVKEIVIPVSLTYLALDGASEILETVENVRRTYKKRDLKISMVVPTLYRRTRLADAILGKLREFFGESLAKSVIGYNVAIDEAQSMGQTIWDYAPRSRGAEMLSALAEEIIAVDD